MEKVYAPENFLATEPLEMGKYFQEYSQVCPLTFNNLENPKERSQKILEDEFGLKFSLDEIFKMEETCSVDKLRAKKEVSELPMSDIPADHKIVHSYKISKDCNHLETVKCKKKFNTMQEGFYSSLTVKTAKIEEETEHSDLRDISTGSTFIYKLIFYKPFSTLTEKRITIENVVSMCEIEVLGTNTLEQLCDNIKCVSDRFRFAPLENTRQNLEKLRNPIITHPSRCFFIENIFYTDDRHENATDYTEIVINWAKDNKIGEFDKKDMKVRIDTLKPRLGFGYVYIHQGKCEHVFTFTDARLIQGTDCLISSKYPKMLLNKVKCNYMCFICRHTQASWLVAESDRIPVSKAYLCTSCCNSYMFLKNKKLGNFKLYRHFNEDVDVEKVSPDCDEEILGVA